MFSCCFFNFLSLLSLCRLGTLTSNGNISLAFRRKIASQLFPFIGFFFFSYRLNYFTLIAPDSILKQRVGMKKTPKEFINSSYRFSCLRDLVTCTLLKFYGRFFPMIVIRAQIWNKILRDISDLISSPSTFFHSLNSILRSTFPFILLCFISIHRSGCFRKLCEKLYERSSCSTLSSVRRVPAYS